RAALEIGRDVVGGVESPFVVGCPRGVEHVIAHLAAVNAQLVVAEPADVGPRASRALGKLEFGAKLVGAANPLPFPIVVIEQPRVEPRRLAVLARLALL